MIGFNWAIGLNHLYCIVGDTAVQRRLHRYGDGRGSERSDIEDGPLQGPVRVAIFRKQVGTAVSNGQTAGRWTRRGRRSRYIWF